jgi:hypothetical protein
MPTKPPFSLDTIYDAPTKGHHWIDSVTPKAIGPAGPCVHL